MSSSATISDTLREASQRLREARVPNDLLDAQTLLAHALGRDRTYLIINYLEELPAEMLTIFNRLIERRAAGEPLQYITGRQEFFGLEFEVTPAVLIPRPETELIVEEAVRLNLEMAARSLNGPVIIDVGTGSGCLAIALAREIPDARLIAIDLSPAAIDVARRNARRNGVDDRIEFLVSDLLDAISERPFADLIVSNPPYISIAELPDLPREVREWEPLMALTDNGDGLGLYRRLLRQAPSRLKLGGWLLCELGYQQSGALLDLAASGSWENPRLLEDLQSIPRTLVIRRCAY